MGFAASPGSRDLLQLAGSANEELFSTLKSFVCEERIDRFRGSMLASAGRRVDIVTSTVSFENGMERYSNIRQNSRPQPSLASVSGAWSTGEFGTLLRQTQQLLTVETAALRDFDELDGQSTAVYEFDVSEEDSPWDLIVASEHFHVPFRSRVWLSAASGQILKIVRTSRSMPPQSRITEIEWALELKPADIQGTSWLLPAAGEYSVRYAGLNRREWNLLTFSNYHRYGSEVQIRFDAGN